MLGTRVACLTNHGDMADFDELSRRAPRGMKLIPGVEISSIDGDFLIFSSDNEFLHGLKPAQPLPGLSDRPDDTAVVWAHPFAGVAGGKRMGEDYLAGVAERVDGIEVYNGNWPDEEASSLARRVASRYGLAELGGSDSHRADSLFKCWTELKEIEDATGLVRAIKSKATAAVTQ